MNVLTWSIVLSTTLLISGCSIFSKKPSTVQTVESERTRLDLPLPDPLTGRNVRWIVITPENADQIWKDLKSKNIDLVLFAITDDGYRELSLTMAELRNYISQQRTIIIKYKDYYEPKKQ
jgi:hypothetical protein